MHNVLPRFEAEGQTMFTTGFDQGESIAVYPIICESLS